MIHRYGLSITIHVLDMAAAAIADIGMESRGLGGQNPLIVGVTDNAVGRFRPLDGGMARGAVMFQEGMT